MRLQGATPPEPGSHCAHPPRGRSGRLDALAAGAPNLAPVRARLAASRHRRRAGADDHAGACRDRLCGGLWRAGDLWSLRDHRAVAGLCAVRSQPHSGAGAGLLAGRCHPRRRPAVVGRRPAACRCPGRHDGSRLGAGVHPGRPGAPGLHHGAAVQADPLRLHERHCADGLDQPVAQAVRVLDRRHRTAGRSAGHRHGGDRRPHQLDCLHGRRRHPGGDPAAQGSPSAYRAS